MRLVEKLIKLAEDLEKEGLIEESDQLTDAIEKDLNTNPEPILIDKDDAEMHSMSQPPVEEPISQTPAPQMQKETPSINVDQIEEELTEGVLALLAKNNDFILGENGEIGNSDEEFIDALMNLAS